MTTVDQLIRRISLRDIRICLTVVEQGNLARAASSLSISRPVVSKSVANLERALGVRLLDRSPQGIAPTSYGDGLRFRLRDIEGSSKRTVAVVYTGSVSDQFRAGREVSVKGRLQNGTFVAVKDSLVTKCPSKYTAKKDS